MRQVYKINSVGFYEEPVVIADEDESVEGYLFVETPPPEGLYKPKWTGDTWIEGASQEEIEVIRDTPRPLADQERIIQLETDLGNVLLESAIDKARIVELEMIQGDMLMEIALLKTGGAA